MPARSGIYFSIIGAFQFISMAFLIICCVTAPVFKQIGLSKYESITYGVFGYCSGSDGCSKAKGSYDPYSLTDDTTAWKLKSESRKALGSILIVMPIAAGLNFFAFVAASVSAIMSFLNSSSYNEISAVSFIINIIFQLVAFLSAALMCVVTFLLFYPHVTWCTWLLIPAGVLPLLSLPLLFFAYLSKGPVEEFIDQDEMGLAGNQRLLNVEDLYDTNNNNIDPMSHTVLPDIEPANPAEKKDDSFTFTTRSDSDGTDSSLDKEKFRAYDNSVDNLQHDGANDDDDDDRRDSQQRFSVIESDTDEHKMHKYIPSDSLGSSVYSEKDHYSEVQPKNKIMQDFMNNAPSNNNNNIIPEQYSQEDKGSIVTSVSRNGINNMNNTVPYPGSNVSNQGQRQFQQMPMHMNYPPQQRQNFMPQQRQNYMPQQQAPTASEMIMQNNPNFLPNGSNRMNQRMQRPYQQQGNFQGRGFPQQNGATHFAPAYKRRINNRANVYQNLNGNGNSFGAGGAYNFR
ncbi:similar to Saccharomyces cerevisiae YOL019W (ohnolog of YFR012W) Putative protein of unknown function [Maudiozyma barnettii]|uniref:PH-response regulator protein palI/RIM9 n=1 Tax=Maudiozyma barnettii TaxID=61262 RepID=A0A8H2VFK8_9SACH|nr:Tos7p [Kazachstania barnettii]CAB4254249.1 similar to Saccharomyces cerevisiae YOL019W (ohnolog of YFR012W) Putative protein of unknown function [Kazachstania barnettii]CAD1782009.1 similar to Saccharomyces cerevisiae YOL019W (ohnolog of YFR012W) Putative protein of unknown function [Kazachstania barnettii]